MSCEAEHREKVIINEVLEELTRAILAKWISFGLRCEPIEDSDLSPEARQMDTSAWGWRHRSRYFEAREYRSTAQFNACVGLAYSEEAQSIFVYGPERQMAFVGKVLIGDPDYKRKVLAMVGKVLQDHIKELVVRSRLEANKYVAKAKQYIKLLDRVEALNESQEVQD